MTRQDAEQILLAYREKDDDTGDKHGLRIVKYLGEHLGDHYFEVVSDVKSPKPCDYGEYVVNSNGDVDCVPY